MACLSKMIDWQGVIWWRYWYWGDHVFEMYDNYMLMMVRVFGLTQIDTYTPWYANNTVYHENNNYNENNDTSIYCYISYIHLLTSFDAPIHQGHVMSEGTTTWPISPMGLWGGSISNIAKRAWRKRWRVKRRNDFQQGLGGVKWWWLLSGYKWGYSGEVAGNIYIYNMGVHGLTRVYETVQFVTSVDDKLFNRFQ